MLKEYMLIFTVLEKQKFEDGGKKTCEKDLVCFMLILDPPKEGARSGKLKNNH